MAYQITKQDVWVGEIEDRPHGLASKLDAVAKSGVSLEFLIARRAPEKPGTGVVFLAPLRGEDAAKAATQAGFSKWTTAYSIRVEGYDRPGLAAKISMAIANVGINMRGMSGAELGGRAVFHLAFDRDADADRAKEVLTRVLNE